MNHQIPDAAPDAGNVLKSVSPLLWRAKWLIGGAAIIAAVLTFALYRPNTAQAWTGKTILTIGMAPSTDFVLGRSGPPLTPIESPRNMVARISNPIFRNKVLNQATFEPATAAFSRAMVASSLKGIDDQGDRDVAIELTAGSAADVQAAFRALAAEIGEVHGNILKRRLQPVQARIDEAKRRLALIENYGETLNNRISRTDSDDKSQPSASSTAPNPAVLVPAWNGLRDGIENDTNLTLYSEPSVLNLEANTYILASRSLGTLKASIVAGCIMLAAMIVLTLVVGKPVRVSAD
jgi:hypothetical protein